MATEGEMVTINFQKPDQKSLNKLTVYQAKKYLEEGQFPPGSMGSKIQAAINFVRSSKGKAIITSIDKIEQAIEGNAGTHITKGKY